ncbi:peptidoglycan-binding domain-containing protein [Streptomyces sp. 196(2019)]|uniref:peptidoglycan-binding domain-containing protein n=1 Tax=Streptomyces sp. 196(2019) TaxID=2683820 RepID=UPI0013EDAB7E|nr:peptidoglycan-binding domain-containing protein [Streptomyces sp. 196(2019)]NGO83497.1 peptidoglycan-binding protein [Streptomyces sp. 196(2019)]
MIIWTRRGNGIAARCREVLTGAAVCSTLALGVVLAGSGTAAAAPEARESTETVSAQAACSVYWRNGVDYDGLTAGYSWAWNVLVAQGNTGDRVREIQCLLNYHGFGVTVDGDFGPATASKVRSFQSARNIGVDGKVGPSTWRQLRK